MKITNIYYAPAQHRIGPRGIEKIDNKKNNDTEGKITILRAINTYYAPRMELRSSNKHIPTFNLHTNPTSCILL